MIQATELLATSIVAIMYFGDVVFAVSGALTAARYRMDVLGFVLIGIITGIGGGVPEMQLAYDEMIRFFKRHLGL